jgi:hypothetical protein
MRILVLVKEMRTSLTKHYRGNYRNVTAQAFQNGTGSVALTMSSLFQKK